MVCRYHVLALCCRALERRTERFWGGELFSLGEFYVVPRSVVVLTENDPFSPLRPRCFHPYRSVPFPLSVSTLSVDVASPPIALVAALVATAAAVSVCVLSSLSNRFKSSPDGRLGKPSYLAPEMKKGKNKIGKKVRGNKKASGGFQQYCRQCCQQCCRLGAVDLSFSASRRCRTIFLHVVTVVLFCFCAKMSCLPITTFGSEVHHSFVTVDGSTLPRCAYNP